MPSLWDKFKDKLEERLNWETFKEEAFQSPISPAPLGLVGLSSSSAFPRVYKLGSEIAFQDRDAIARAIPNFIRGIARNKPYDFGSEKEIADTIKELVKVPNRYGKNTKLIDRVKAIKELEKEYVTRAVASEDVTPIGDALQEIRPAESPVNFGKYTGATNLYAALIKTLHNQGFLRPYNEARHLLYQAGFTGGIK